METAPDQQLTTRGPNRWPKGTSGNLGGRPRSGTSLSELLRGRLESEKRMLIDKLLELANGGESVPPLVQLGAIRIALQYGCGLPFRQSEEDNRTLVVQVEYVDEGKRPDAAESIGGNEGEV